MNEEPIDCSDLRMLINRIVEWCDSLLKFISEKLGEEAVGEAMERVIDEVYRPRFEGLRSMTYKELVDYYYRSFKARNYEFTVIEERDKIVFVITRCTTGGKLIEDGKAGKTRNKWPWSFNEIGFPYYCTHTYFFNKLWSELGVPVRVEPEQPGRLCRYIFFKT
jgi:hypothetical protein